MRPLDELVDIEERKFSANFWGGEKLSYFQEKITLEGKKVILKSIGKEDTAHVICWRNQPFVNDKFIYQELFTKESHEKWLETMVNTGKVQQFIIFAKQEGKEEGYPIGSVYLRDIDLEKNQKAEFGIFIGEKEYLGKGFGTDATKTILKYGFENLKLHKIMLRVFASNKRAIESYERAGFVEEGYLKDEVKIRNEYRDIILMASFRTKNFDEME